jgi:predicted transcriptional regulator
MATSAIAEEMNTYFLQLSEAEQKSVVQLLKTFVHNRASEQDEPIDIEQYNKDIDESLSEIERGEFYTHEQVIKSMKNI